MIFSRSCASLVKYPLEVDALRSLNRQTERPVPDQLSQWTQTARHAEGSRVIECLLEAVVVEQDAG